HDHDALLWIDQNKKSVSESPVRILRVAACDSDTAALPRRNDHHDLVAEATRIVQEERRDSQAGQLGNKRGARYRTYERLQDFIRHREGDIFLTDQVRPAIQAIYDHPLPLEAVAKLIRQLRTGISDTVLAKLVTTLHSTIALVVANL